MNSNQLKTIFGVTFARLRFLAVFLVAALIVGYWDDIKNRVDQWTRPAVAPDSLAASPNAPLASTFAFCSGSFCSANEPACCAD